MEQINTEIFLARAKELSSRIEDNHRQSVYTMMQSKLIDCDAQKMSMTFAFPGLPWEMNPTGAIQGGLVCTMFDTAMGITSYGLTGNMTPTLNLNTSFLRPAPGNGTLMVRAWITMGGQSVVYVSAEMWEEKTPDQIVATAQGVFRRYQKDLDKKRA